MCEKISGSCELKQSNWRRTNITTPGKKYVNPLLKDVHSAPFCGEVDIRHEKTILLNISAFWFCNTGESE